MTRNLETPDDARKHDKARRDLQKLLALEAPVENLGVHLVADGSTAPRYRWLSLKRPDPKQPRSAAKRFLEVIEGGLQKLRKIQRESGLNLCLHDATLRPGFEELEYVDLNAKVFAAIRARLAPLSEGGPHPLFDGAKDFVDSLRFYIISADLGGETLHAFRLVSPKIELGRSRRFAIVGGRSGAYDLADDKTFLFDDGVDCLQWKGWLYILHRTQFQQIFDYYQVMERQRDRALEGLEKLRLVDRVDDLHTDSDGIAQKTKLAHIAEGPLIQQDALPEGFWERAEEVVELFDLPIRVVGEGDEKQFVYNAKHLWQLLHLLDDDYLVSPMAPQPTSKGYLALHKRARKLTHEIAVIKAQAVPARAPKKTAALRAGPRRVG